MVNEISKQTVSLQSNIDIKPVESTETQQQTEGSSVDNGNKETSVLSVVDDTVNRLNEAVQSIERDLQFQVDEASGDTVITVLDTQTKEVIRQIPTEEVLAVRENIETLKGILFSAKV